MSMRQHPRATMPGWKGPFYPTTVARLATALSFVSSCDLIREKAFDATVGVVSGYEECRREQSHDGYWWLWVAEFRVHLGRVLVAVPWQRDAKQRDGNRLDRAPAVYTQGCADMNDAAAAAARMARALCQ